MASPRTKQALLSIFGGVAKAAVATAGTKKRAPLPEPAPVAGRLAGLQKPAKKKPCGACGGK